MDKRDIDNDDASIAFEPPGADDIEAVVAYYERTGTMPLNTIGPPIDRPIIPSRRPDRLGDFNFTIRAAAAAPAPTAAEEAADPEAEKIRQEFIQMLNDELKGL
jgi:hypothetical protein